MLLCGFTRACYHAIGLGKSGYVEIDLIGGQLVDQLIVYNVFRTLASIFKISSKSVMDLLHNSKEKSTVNYYKASW